MINSSVLFTGDIIKKKKSEPIMRKYVPYERQ